MTAVRPGAEPSSGGPRHSLRRLPRWAVAVLLVVVVAAAGIAIAAGGGRSSADEDGPTGDAAATATAPSPSATAPAPPISPAPTGPTEDATELPPGQAPVPLDAPADVGGVTVSLAAVESIEGRASGPGDVAGPAVRVTVRLENGTPDPLDLLGVSVQLTYGADAVPGSPLGDPSVAMFAGVLEPGGTSEGVYVFAVPPDGQDAVTVTVGHQPGAPFAIFTGAV